MRSKVARADVLIYARRRECHLKLVAVAVTAELPVKGQCAGQPQGSNVPDVAIAETSVHFCFDPISSKSKSPFRIVAASASSNLTTPLPMCSAMTAATKSCHVNKPG